jgi:quinol monooxygenase YgiN
MAVTVIADLSIKPDRVKWVISFLQGVLPDTRKAEGCLGAELHQNQDDPNNLIIVQEFATREHYHSYMKDVTGGEEPSFTVKRYFASFERPAIPRYFDHIES